MSRAMNLLGVALCTATAGLIAGCGGDDREANTGQPAPPQCPPGQYYDGQYCRAQQGSVPPTGGGYQDPGTGQTGQPGQPQPQPPIATGAQGPNATPLDPMLAQGATQILSGLAQQYAVAGSKPVGGAIAGQFQQGQILEQQVQMQPGKCYTVVAAGLPPIQNVDVQIVAALPMPGLPSPVLAQDQTVSPNAVIGEKPNCFKWAWPVAGAVKIVLSVPQGQGMAAAQVFEK